MIKAHFMPIDFSWHPSFSFNWLEYLPTEASIRKSMEQLIRGYITMMEDEMNKGSFQIDFKFFECRRPYYLTINRKMAHKKLSEGS